jgi:hypothetical protein
MYACLFAKAEKKQKYKNREKNRNIKTNRDTARIHLKLNELRYTLCYADYTEVVMKIIAYTSF